MFWRYNRHWNTFDKFVIVYYKTLGTAFAAILKHLFYLETGVSFLQSICGLRYEKLDGVKMRKGSLASGKTLVWSISRQNLIPTDIELG